MIQDEHTVASTPEGDMYAYGAVLEVLLHSAHGGSEPDHYKDMELLLSIIERCKTPDPSKRPTSSTMYFHLSDKASETRGSLFVAQSTHSPWEVVPEENRWRMVRSTSDSVTSYVSGRDDAYLCTPPIDGRGERPLRKLCFQLKCHDQGAQRTSM